MEDGLCVLLEYSFLVVGCYACLGLLIVLFIMCVLFVVLRCMFFTRVRLFVDLV